MGADPIGQSLRPRCLGVRKIRRTHYSNKYLRLSNLSGQAIDHRHAISRVVDEQLVAAGVALAHRHRQPACPIPVELTESRIPIALGILFDVLVPQNRQRDVLALELAMDLAKVRLSVAAVSLLAAGRAVELFLQRLVADVVAQRPTQPRRSEALHHRSHCRWRDPQPPGNLPASDVPGKCQTKNLAHLAHRHPLGWHPPPPSDSPKGSDPTALPAAADSPSCGGRHHFGTVGGIISEWWATSFRNGGRDHFGTVAASPGFLIFELCVDVLHGFESVVLEDFLPNLVPQIFLRVEL